MNKIKYELLVLKLHKHDLWRRRKDFSSGVNNNINSCDDVQENEDKKQHLIKKKGVHENYQSVKCIISEFG